MNNIIQITKQYLPDLSDTSCARLAVIADRLVEMNTHLNLTALTAPEEVALLHFYDSLTLLSTGLFDGAYKVLDVGCGSGILSIAALLLGAQSAVGVDIDALAVKMAVENGAINGFTEPQYRMIQGDLVQQISGQYELVVANIVADAIIMLSKNISTFLKPGGTYIVSGIIDTREQEVVAALTACGFIIRERREHGGWLCFVCGKD